MKKIFLTLSIALLMASCNTDDNENKKTETDTTQTSEEPKQGGDPIVDKDGILSLIPDPVETAALIKGLGARYDKSALNPTDKKSSYAKAHEQALNLGVYSADLAYANIYEQHQDAIDYLTAIKELADGISISQHFDFEKIKQLTSEGKNLEELMKVTLSNLHKVNQELQNEGRGDMTIYVISGGWLEALYLSCYVAKNTDNVALKENIADQKIVLAQILTLLSNNKDKSEHIAQLHSQFERVSKAFEPINLEYGKVEASGTDGEGGVVVEQKVDVKLKFSDADFDNLFNTIVEVRKEITK